MVIESVVRNVRFAPHKPFERRRCPLERRVPWLEPGHLARRIRPKFFGVGARLIDHFANGGIGQFHAILSSDKFESRFSKFGKCRTMRRDVVYSIAKCPCRACSSPL